jgi:hypothetical protein
LVRVDQLPAGVVPERIQSRRIAGWRKPPHTIYVGRPTMWGNRWKVGTWSNTLGRNVATVEEAIALYGEVGWPEGHMRGWLRENLAGRNLMCWCRLCDVHAAGKRLGVVCSDCAPCHADWLLNVVNPGAINRCEIAS